MVRRKCNNDIVIKLISAYINVLYLSLAGLTMAQLGFFFSSDYQSLVFVLCFSQCIKWFDCYDTLD